MSIRGHWWDSIVRPARLENVTELMDLPGQSPDLLRGVVESLDRLNRLSLGYWRVKRMLGQIMLRPQVDPDLSVLDLGAGGGDLAYEIATWAHEHGWSSPRVVASDFNEQILDIAREKVDRRGGSRREVQIVQADALSLPFDDNEFSVACCSLTLHHFCCENAVRVLSEMARVSRKGIIVEDLSRTWPNLAAAHLIFGLRSSDNPLESNDGPISVRRAYTKKEITHLLTRAGLEVEATWCTIPGLRIGMFIRLR